MNWHTFHHPDISWPVMRRQAGIELLELLELTARLLLRGGWAEANRNTYPSNAAYKTAISRLGKQGLLINKGTGSSMPNLILTEEGAGCLPPYLQPEKYWNRSWNKIWYMLMYDVPESDRKYRNVLRQFLKRKRMGCLQKSVWVTPEDIRPDFDDLTKAANVGAYAFLFESRSVLGMKSEQIAEGAWNFDILEQLQSRFCSVTERNIELLSAGKHTPDELYALMRITADGYHGAMIHDPLLPWQLYPVGYAGKRVLSLYHKLIKEADRQRQSYR
jgi:phenylacetic acid degradation operon negative regulatory protein